MPKAEQYWLRSIWCRLRSFRLQTWDTTDLRDYNLPKRLLIKQQITESLINQWDKRCKRWITPHTKALKIQCCSVSSVRQRRQLRDEFVLRTTHAVYDDGYQWWLYLWAGFPRSAWECSCITPYLVPTLSLQASTNSSSKKTPKTQNKVFLSLLFSTLGGCMRSKIKSGKHGIKSPYSAPLSAKTNFRWHIEALQSKKHQWHLVHTQTFPLVHLTVHKVTNKSK